MEKNKLIKFDIRRIGESIKTIIKVRRDFIYLILIITGLVLFVLSTWPEPSAQIINKEYIGISKDRELIDIFPLYIEVESHDRSISFVVNEYPKKSIDFTFSSEIYDVNVEYTSLDGKHFENIKGRI